MVIDVADRPLTFEQLVDIAAAGRRAKMFPLAAHALWYFSRPATSGLSLTVCYQLKAKNLQLTN